MDTLTNVPMTALANAPANMRWGFVTNAFRTLRVCAAKALEDCGRPVREGFARARWHGGLLPLPQTVRWRLLAPLALALVALTPTIARADWELVGDPKFSEGSAERPLSLALSSTGVSYVAYKDFGAGGGNKATVMRFFNSAWETVGDRGFSGGTVESLSLVLSPAGVPYVGYRDFASSGKATVMRFFNNAWETVGSQGFSAGAATHLSLALSSGDEPYVAYRDAANSNRVTVMHFTSGNWELVGGDSASTGGASHISLTMSSRDEPYVAYRDTANDNKATVMRFVNDGWEPVGNPGFSQEKATYLSLALSSSDAPYVAYQADTAPPNTGSGAVMRFVNNSWELVGDLGLSAGKANNFSLVLSSRDEPYVAYEDWDKIPGTAARDYSGATTVMRFVNNDWELVGDRGFPEGNNASDPSLALSSNNELYVAYRHTNKATVMHFAFPPEPEPPVPEGGVTAVPAFSTLALLALALGLGAVMRTGLRRRGG